jgi:hypothetical protein
VVQRRLDVKDDTQAMNPIITKDLESLSPATFDNLLWRSQPYDPELTGVELPRKRPIRA